MRANFQKKLWTAPFWGGGVLFFSSVRVEHRQKVPPRQRIDYVLLESNRCQSCELEPSMGRLSRGVIRVLETLALTDPDMTDKLFHYQEKGEVYRIWRGQRVLHLTFLAYRRFFCFPSHFLITAVQLCPKRPQGIWVSVNLCAYSAETLSSSEQKLPPFSLRFKKTIKRHLCWSLFLISSPVFNQPGHRQAFSGLC